MSSIFVGHKISIRLGMVVQVIKRVREGGSVLLKKGRLHKSLSWSVGVGGGEGETL